MTPDNKSATYTGSAVESVISVDNLSCRYGKTVAVDDISFTVKKGEIFSFLGPNGAGNDLTFNIESITLRK